MKKLLHIIDIIVTNPWSLFVFGLSLGICLAKNETAGVVFNLVAVASWAINRRFAKVKSENL